jgi:MYXO-CTERM domain-containing protein
MRRRLFVALGLAVLIALVPGAALAHYPEVQGEQRCELNEDGDGVLYTLHYTATAWNEEGLDPDRRVNQQIGITVTDKHSGQVIWQDDDAGEFDADNGYSFSGTVDLGSEPRTVIVRAQAMVPWGPDPENNPLADEGPAKEKKVRPKGDCPEPTPTTTPPPTTKVEILTETPTPTPTGELPFTGSGSPATLIAGFALLVVGYLALRITRHRAAHLHKSD